MKVNIYLIENGMEKDMMKMEILFLNLLMERLKLMNITLILPQNLRRIFKLKKGMEKVKNIKMKK